MCVCVCVLCIYAYLFVFVWFALFFFLLFFFLEVSAYLQRMRFCHPAYSPAVREPRGLPVTSMHFQIKDSSVHTVSQGIRKNRAVHRKVVEIEGLRIVIQNWKE